MSKQHETCAKCGMPARNQQICPCGDSPKHEKAETKKQEKKEKPGK